MRIPKKTCTMCGKALSFQEYYNHPKTADGKQSQCKACIVVSNKTRLRAYQRVANDSPVTSAGQAVGLVLTGAFQ